MVSDPIPVIQATLSPIFLVSGASIFLNFLQSRLFRINDRVRSYVDAKAALAADDPAHASMNDLMTRLTRRQQVIRNAVIMCVVTVLFTVLCTIFVIVPAVVPVTVPGQVVVIALAFGLLSFAGALILALQDTLLSVRMVEAERRQ